MSKAGLTETQRRMLEGRELVLSISGGKDSTATALWLREQGLAYRMVFADTGWEAPQLYKYLRGDLAAALGPIEEVRGELSFADLVRRKAMFPSRRFRWCTADLKAEPLNRYHRGVAEQTGRPVVSVVGIRAEESRSRALAEEWDEWAATGVRVWRPILRWSTQDVIDIHHRHGLRPCPLYLSGALRVGCWPCVHARKSELALIGRIDPDRVALVERLEVEALETRRRRLRERTGRPDAEPRWPPTMFSRQVRGETLTMGIREAVEWATDDTGQGELWGEGGDPDHGCLRWGLCGAGGEE